MARDDRDQDVAAERSPRPRTDRLSGGAGEPTGTINPNWRARSQGQGRSRPNAAIPTSGQDFIVWLQFGGWKFVLAAALLIVIVIIFVIITGQPSANNATVDTPPNLISATRPAVTLQTPLPTVTPAAVTATPAEAAATAGAKFRVTGTGDQGLFLRADPSANQAPIKTLPEGTMVTIVGDDVVKPERVWKHVRDDQGSDGYVAADFLKPVSP